MWVLIIYIYAGALASGDSVSLTNVDGFTSQQACQEAGAQGKGLVSTSSKVYKFVCVQKK